MPINKINELAGKRTDFLIGEKIMILGEEFVHGVLDEFVADVTLVTDRHLETNQV